MIKFKTRREHLLYCTKDKATWIKGGIDQLNKTYLIESTLVLLIGVNPNYHMANSKLWVKMNSGIILDTF